MTIARLVAGWPPDGLVDVPGARMGGDEATFGQVSTLVSMRFIDGRDRQLEVIQLDRGHGSRAWIKVSQHGILLGASYYRTPEEALALVDIETLVEVIPLRPAS
jgi:hypothetical protein